MKQRPFVTLAASILFSALSCPGAMLIVDGHTNQSAAEGVPGIEFRQEAGLTFFQDAGIESSSPGQFEGLWFLTGFITLDSADFQIDSPLTNADVAGASATVPTPRLGLCDSCSGTANKLSGQRQNQESRITYTLVMTSFPSAAEGVYTNAIHLNRKMAREPYAILMLPGGLAAVESIDPR